MARPKPELYAALPEQTEIPAEFLRALTEGLLLALREEEILGDAELDQALERLP